MAARHTVTLTPDVRCVLERSTITANSVTLPEQLERKLYESVNKVLTIAGGKWNRSAKAHIFAGDPRTALGLALETGEILDRKKALQQFFTPEDIADKIAQIVLAARRGPTPTLSILEPSAGHGALADAVRDRCGLKPYCVDIDQACVDVLKSKRHNVVHGDFLTMSPDDFLDVRPLSQGEPWFDVVVMNPPFSGDQDIRHVEHALTFLRPGGTLIAIVAPGFTFGETKTRRDFRALVDEIGSYEELPEGTFKESSTNVRTVLLILTKPSATTTIEPKTTNPLPREHTGETMPKNTTPKNTKPETKPETETTPTDKAPRRDVSAAHKASALAMARASLKALSLSHDIIEAIEAGPVKESDFAALKTEADNLVRAINQLSLHAVPKKARTAQAEG